MLQLGAGLEVPRSPVSATRRRRVALQMPSATRRLLVRCIRRRKQSHCDSRGKHRRWWRRMGHSGGQERSSEERRWVPARPAESQRHVDWSAIGAKRSDTGTVRRREQRRTPAGQRSARSEGENDRSEPAAAGHHSSANAQAAHRTSKSRVFFEPSRMVAFILVSTDQSIRRLSLKHSCWMCLNVGGFQRGPGLGTKRTAGRLTRSDHTARHKTDSEWRRRAKLSGAQAVS